MVKSMYAAVSGLRSHQSKMDVISNNIANVNTWGFKSKNTSFTDSMYANSKIGSKGNNNTGGTNASQVGFGVNVSSISVNFATGAFNPTGRALDCMINGSGFFIVGSKNANGIDQDKVAENSLKLSKVGIFSVDSDGYLVDDSGNFVYGYEYDTATNKMKNEATDKLKPIQIPKDQNGDLPTIQTYKIGDDGTIVGVDKSEKIITIGQIAVASVQNPNGLEHTQGYYFTPGENAGKIVGMVTTPATGKILSGYLEMSNVDLAKEISDMITTQRGYQANTKIVTVTDEMLNELVSMKR